MRTVYILHVKEEWEDDFHPHSAWESEADAASEASRLESLPGVHPHDQLNCHVSSLPLHASGGGDS